jgi:hypothetical protein
MTRQSRQGALHDYINKKEVERGVPLPAVLACIGLSCLVLFKLSWLSGMYVHTTRMHVHILYIYTH